MYTLIKARTHDELARRMMHLIIRQSGDPRNAEASKKLLGPVYSLKHLVEEPLGETLGGMKQARKL